MKKFLFGALALFVLVSCNKDDNTGIPPIDGIDNPTSTIQVVNASDIDDAYYQANKAKKVAVKGAITMQGTKSFLKLKDNTLILIFAQTSVFNTLSQETKDKLKIEGQEITVTGTFTDYTHPTTGVLTKEIVYSKEGDLVFGNTPTITIVELEASTATVTDYAEGKNVKLHGTITISNNKPHFKFSDNTLIQIYAPKSVFDALSQEAKSKLTIEGQEVTVTGKFADYKLQTGEVIKEIVYSKEADLVFGNTPQVIPTTPVDVEASTTNLDDVYEADKLVKVHGTITYENNRSWIAFKDGKKVQLYIVGYNSLQPDTKTKLGTNGQEITVTGKFGEYNGTKQVKVEKETDLVFGTTPAPNPNPNPNPNPSTGNKFDFEDITPSGTGYASEGDLKAADGTILTYKARNEMKDGNNDYSIQGKGLMFRKAGDNSFITLVFSSNVTKVKFQARGAFTTKTKRIIAVFNGDKDSTNKIEEKEFSYAGSSDTTIHDFTVDLSSANTRTITFKTLVQSNAQVVIDNISWE